MTDKLKCPFCGESLKEFGGCDFPLLHYCDNINCNLYHIMGQYTLWQALIDGKKAQRQQRTTKDRCAKKTKAKEREIANYLNGISVRDKEIQNLREQLQKAQDMLNYVLPNLDTYMNMYLETRRNPLEFAVANEYINNIKRKITEWITKQEE